MSVSLHHKKSAPFRRFYVENAAEGGNRKKLVVSKSALKARACKRLADANMPFCGKGGATERCEKSPIRKENGGF